MSLRLNQRTDTSSSGSEGNTSSAGLDDGFKGLGNVEPANVQLLAVVHCRS